MDYAALAHYRVKHSKNDFSYATLVTLWDANGKNHINGIENFFQRECEHKSYDLRCYCEQTEIC